MSGFLRSAFVVALVAQGVEMRMLMVMDESIYLMHHTHWGSAEWMTLRLIVALIAFLLLLAAIHARARR